MTTKTLFIFFRQPLHLYLKYTMALDLTDEKVVSSSGTRLHLWKDRLFPRLNYIKIYFNGVFYPFERGLFTEVFTSANYLTITLYY